MKERGGIHRELLAGSLSGAAGVVAGNPLDTIRVRIQTVMVANATQKYTGTVDCAAKMFRIEGTRSFFKGMASPLASIPLSNATIFAVYGNCLATIRQHYKQKNSLLPEATAGFVAGFANSFILCPVEYVKIQRQIDPTRTPHSLSYSQIRSAFNYSTIKKGFHGLSATVLRDGPGFAFYFSSYELMRQNMASAINHEHGNSIAAFTAGGIAGALSWIVSCPFDVIKSNMQANPLKNSSFTTCCKNLYRFGGTSAFFKGLQASVLRAIPTNAVIFLVYETVHNMI